MFFDVYLFDMGFHVNLMPPRAYVFDMEVHVKFDMGSMSNGLTRESMSKGVLGTILCDLTWDPMSGNVRESFYIRLTWDPMSKDADSV